MYTYIHVCVCVCVYMCLYVYTYTYIHTYIHIHTYIQTDSQNWIFNWVLKLNLDLQGIVCTNPLSERGEGGWTSYKIFKKGVLDRNLSLARKITYYIFTFLIYLIISNSFKFLLVSQNINTCLTLLDSWIRQRFFLYCMLVVLSKVSGEF